MEKALEQIALAVSATMPAGQQISPQSAERALQVRQYLVKAGIMTDKEAIWIAGLYGALSNAGNHANLSDHEHARIFRPAALNAAHFALLRYQRHVAKQAPTP